VLPNPDNSSAYDTVVRPHLPRFGCSCMKTAMTNRATSVASRQTGFAGETVRALASALLLLGLIGDRRVR
jgi:hypothetical protein